MEVLPSQLTQNSSNSASVNEDDSAYSSHPLDIEAVCQSSEESPRLHIKPPIIEQIDDSQDELVDESSLKRKIEILEEKCFKLTCKQLDLKLKESSEIEDLLGQNSQLTKENYRLKQQYSCNSILDQSDWTDWKVVFII